MEVPVNAVMEIGRLDETLVGSSFLPDLAHGRESSLGSFLKEPRMAASSGQRMSVLSRPVVPPPSASAAPVRNGAGATNAGPLRAYGRPVVQRLGVLKSVVG